MGTIPTDELRTNHGNLSRAGIVLIAIGLVSLAGWIARGAFLAN